MTGQPELYFAVAELLFAALEFPDIDRLSRKPLTANGLAEVFAENNVELPANAIRIKTNSRSWLQEIRASLGKNLKLRRCTTFMQGETAKAEVKIWRGR